MHELKDFTKNEIEEWLKEQEEYAAPLRQRVKEDTCYMIGTSIIGCVEGLRHGLTGYREDKVIQRQRQTHMGLRDEWKKSHSGHLEPPQDMFGSMNVDAGKSAFRELYPEIAHLAKEIADLRTQAETQFKCQG